MKNVIFLILFISLFSLNSFSKGIIIGFDTTVLNIFKHKDSSQVKNLAKDVSVKYNRVIIHLGRKYPFTRSFFSDESCRRNLSLFCNELHNNNVKVYMWLLDSYGCDNFNKLYKEHRNIVSDAVDGLEKYEVYYDGIVVDMEWINYPKGNNNSKFIDVLKFIRSKIKSKELYAFAPIIDDNKTNIKRGYDMRRISNIADNVIAMIYVVNSDLCNCGNYSIEPCMNDHRINDLRKYFSKKGYLSAVSMNQGIIIRNDKGEYVFSKPVKDESDEIFYKLKLAEKNNYKNYEVNQYNSITDFEFTDENGIIEKIKSDESVYFIKLKKNILKDEDFIWEYSLVEKMY